MMGRRVRGKLARTVLTGGKAGDDFKGLPIGIDHSENHNRHRRWLGIKRSKRIFLRRSGGTSGFGNFAFSGVRRQKRTPYCVSIQADTGLACEIKSGFKSQSQNLFFGAYGKASAGA